MIYIWCFVSSTFFAWLASRSKDKGVMLLCSVISILIPSILGGLRAHGIGTDTKVYGQRLALDAFNAPDLLYFIKSYPSAGDGYLALTYVVMQIFGHENWCYFFYQVITITGPYICAYKHRKTISMPFMFLLWLLTFYNISYNAIRQCIAASIILMNLDMLEKKQYKKFIATIAVAYLFHKTTLIAFVLIFGIHYVITSDAVQKNLWLKIFIFYSSIVSMFVVRPVLFAVVSRLPFGEHYIYYFDSGYNDRMGTSKTQILLMLTLFTMMIFYNKRATHILSGKIGCKYNIEFFRYNLIFWVVYTIIIRFASDRVLMYNSYINVFILSVAPNFIKEKHLKFMAMMSILAIVTYMWWTNIIRYGFNATYPYRSIL